MRESKVNIATTNAFRNAKTMVEEQAEARGDVIIFCPKFHPELSPIESAYREVAKKLRIDNVVGLSRGTAWVCQSAKKSVFSQLVGPLFTFLGCCSLWPHCSGSNDPVTSNTAPANPH